MPSRVLIHLFREDLTTPTSNGFGSPETPKNAHAEFPDWDLMPAEPTSGPQGSHPPSSTSLLAKALMAAGFNETNSYGGPPSFVSPNTQVFFQLPAVSPGSPWWELKSPNGDQVLNSGHDLPSLQKVLKLYTPKNQALDQELEIPPGVEVKSKSPAKNLTLNGIKQDGHQYQLSDGSMLFTGKKDWAFAKKGTAKFVHGSGQEALNSLMASSQSDQSSQGKYPGGELDKPAISADFLENTEGFTASPGSSWNNGTATRYWKSNNGMEAQTTVSVIIGTSPKIFNQWQIWEIKKGVVASGIGQASFNNAYAKFISTKDKPGLKGPTPGLTTDSLGVSYKGVLKGEGFEQQPSSEGGYGGEHRYYTNSSNGATVKLTWHNNSFTWDYVGLPEIGKKTGTVSGKTAQQLSDYLKGFGPPAVEAKPPQSSAVAPSVAQGATQIAPGTGSGISIDDMDDLVKELKNLGIKNGYYLTYDEMNEVIPQEETTGEQIEYIMSMLTNFGIVFVDNDVAIGDATDKLIALGKKRGYLTHTELNAVIDKFKLTPQQVNEMEANFVDMGINIVDSEEDVPKKPAPISQQDTLGYFAGSPYAHEVLDTLNQNAISVAGDQWNKALAVRLEAEYIQTRPVIENLINESLGDTADVSGDDDGDDDDSDDDDSDDDGDDDDSDDSDDDSDDGNNWDDLSSDQQDNAEEQWRSANYDSYYESEVSSWRENNEEEAAREAAYLFNDNNENKWAFDAIAEFIKEWEDEDKPQPGDFEPVISGKGPIPYTAEQILDIMTLDEDDGEPEFDFSRIPQDVGQDTRQMDLPGIASSGSLTNGEVAQELFGRDWNNLSREEALVVTDEMRRRENAQKSQETSEWEKPLWQAVKDAADDWIEKIRDNLDIPDYLSDNAKEYMDQVWNEKDDDEKFDHAKEYLDLDDNGSSGSGGSSAIFDRLPNKFDPLNLTTGEDYNRTQLFAKHISLKRATQILAERGIIPMQHAVKDADDNIWRAWKDSSSSSQGLALQVATAEELGGRLRMPPSDKERSIEYANAAFRSIGGYEGMKAVIRAKWETTQYMLDQAGHHVLNLYRGIGLDVSDQPVEKIKYYDKLPNTIVLRNGAASTTINPSIANGWGSGGRTRVVLRLEVPRTAAISVPAYGQNIHSEQEVIVAGTAWSRWDAWVGTAPQFNDVAMDTVIPKLDEATHGVPLVIDILGIELGQKLPHWLSKPKSKYHRASLNLLGR